MRFRWVWPWATLLLFPLPGRGQERTLTLDEALALARERPAAVALAAGRVEEARAREARAGRRFREEPVLEAVGGYRRDRGGDLLDFETTVSQGLDSGARRSARLAGSRAAVARAEAELAEARRQLLRQVAAAFARAEVAGRRAALLDQGREGADGLLATVERRYEEGETTALELNRARTTAAAARAARESAQAEGDAARAELAALLGLPSGETVALHGGSAPPPPELSVLLAGLDGRPDLAALAAELREAEAEVQLGRSLSRPEVGLLGGLARDGGADVVRAGVTLSLPVHGVGSEAVAVGEARAAALRRALDAARSAAETEVRGLHAVLSRRLAAARELERTAFPSLDDNEALARRSFEVGEINLGELLLVRREILETRLSHLDLLLEARLAAVELETAAGVLR